MSLNAILVGAEFLTECHVCGFLTADSGFVAAFVRNDFRKIPIKSGCLPLLHFPYLFFRRDEAALFFSCCRKGLRRLSVWQSPEEAEEMDGDVCRKTEIPLAKEESSVKF